jgi:hypothetical protein
MLTRKIPRAWSCSKSLSVLAVVTSMAVGCRRGASDTTSLVPARSTRVANLHALARLYGVVRWFHPSDAASVVDWDQLAVDGVRRVIDARDSNELRAGLNGLFASVAPTMHIVGRGEQFPEALALHPQSSVGLEAVAWQHRGYGDSTLAFGYASKRLHRDREVAVEGGPSAMVSQSIDATPYRGRAIRLRGKVRAANQGQGRLWLRVDIGDIRGFYENMARRPVMSKSWSTVEIIGTVDSNATRIAFGGIMSGSGTTWYDDLELSEQVQHGSWNPIVIKEGGFETPDPFATWRPGNGKPGQEQANEGWSVAVDHDRPASGAASLRIQRATQMLTEELFREAPSLGETVDIDLGSELRARVPIVLYSKDGHTMGDDPAAALRVQEASVAASSGDFDSLAGVADVIVVWNALTHFWPYWDVVTVDWHAQLDIALDDAFDDRSTDEHVMTMQRLSAAAPDAHASTVCPGESKRAFPPFAVDLVEGQVMVTTTANKAIERGDVILAVDGRPIAQALATEEALVSGSPQWRRARAVERLGRGPTGSTIALRLLRRGGELDVAVLRSDRIVSDVALHPPIERFPDGVYYIDLERVSMADIDAAMDHLATAPGIVFDLRIGPNANHQVLSHLLSRHDDALWMAIPLVIRPDSASTPASWQMSGWDMPVLQPRITGRVAFVTGPYARSYTESVLGLVAHYRLGEIVGAATAGTNGDIAQISEPTGCTTLFTGRRVTNPDGSRFHLIGVQPTIPTSRTMEAVTAGRDELVERALAYARGASS